MGQINLPLLNKTGYSIFWDSCFENLFNYSKDLKFSLFSKKVIKIFLKDRSSKFYLFLKKRLIKKICLKMLDKQRKNLKIRKLDYKKFLISLNNSFKLKNNLNFIKTNKFVPYYGTKIFFIKISNWIVITFRIYLPISKVYLREKKKQKKIFKREKLSFFKSSYIFNINHKYLNIKNKIIF